MILITTSGVRVSVADEKAERLIASGAYALPVPPKAPVKTASKRAPAVRKSTK